MENEASKPLNIGTVILIVVAIIGTVFMIYKLGMFYVSKGTSQISSTLSGFDDSSKQVYDGMSVSGNEVISVINNYWKDEDMQIMVCTKDGADYVYTTMDETLRWLDPDDDDALVGYPVQDANGYYFNTPETGGSGTKAKICVVSDKPTETDYTAGSQTGNRSGDYKKLRTKAGYNDSVAPGTLGYISKSGNYTGSVQKDSTGAVKQITFVQN